MASVFRVKRRRDEDPAEALKLSCKKPCFSFNSGSFPKDDEKGKETNEETKNTKDSKNDQIPKPNDFEFQRLV